MRSASSRKRVSAGYFLIVADFINYAKTHDIPVGPGRGSAAGSLIAYSLGITDIDPIKYDLTFERFLNPERISMPDIDVDFCKNKRDEVIRYVSEKYGKDNVAQIITFGTMKSKAAVRDVGRALGMPYAEVDKIAKLIVSVDRGIEKAINEEPQVGELYQTDPQVKRTSRQRHRPRGPCPPRFDPCRRYRYRQQAPFRIRAALSRTAR